MDGLTRLPRRPVAGPRLGGSPITSTTGYPWVDGDILYAADLNAAIGAGVGSIGRNLLHNPLFNVAQRGVSGFTTNGYTLDRWQIAFLATGQTVAIQQYANPPGSNVFGDESVHYQLLNTFTGSAVAGAYVLLMQNIEDVQRLSGKTVTVSFYANSGTALNLGVCLSQSFGTGGSPSAGVNLIGQKVALTAAWQRFSLTFALPSVSGKTLGTSGNSNTALEFWFSCDNATYGTRNANLGAQSGTIGIWGVQLEIGSVATPLEKPDPRYDLSNCQRFFQVGTLFGQANFPAATALYAIATNLLVQMRATPTLAAASGAYANLSGGTLTPISSTTVGATGSVITGGAQCSINVLYFASADL